MKKLYWVMVILLGVALLTPLALYLALPKILRPLAEGKLSDFGCENPKIVVAKIGKEGAEFSEVHCLLPKRAELTARNVKFSYALRELYGGNIGAIVVESAEVKLLRGDEESKGFTIPKSFFALVPVSEIKIVRINALIPMGEKELARVAGSLGLRFHPMSVVGELEARAEAPKVDVKAVFELSASEANLTFERGEVAYPLFQVDLPKNSKLKLSLRENQLQGEILQANVQLRQGKKSHELRLQNLKAELEERRARAEFKLAYGKDLFEAPLSLEWQPEKQELGFELKPVKVFLAKVWPFAESFFEKGKLPFQFNAGEALASAKGRARLEEKPALIAAEVSTELRKIGGTYDEHKFSGVSAPLRFKFQASSFELLPTLVTISTYDPGFPVKNIAGTIKAAGAVGGLEGVDFQLSEVEAEIFKGKAQVAELAMNSSSLRSKFQLKLEGLDLAEIIALQKQENISGTGTIDGLIPVELTKAGVVVKGGAIKARTPGGRIAYEAGEGLRAAANGNPGLKLAVDVLRNFQYQVLEGKVDYKVSGDLEIALRLEGRNQEWSGGRPVHFNFTVSENLPMLLRSLRIADETGDAIERRMREE